MILSYILAITLLILSVIKMTGIFLDADKDLQGTQKRFIKETRSLHRNQKGSVTLVGILFTFMLSCLLLFFALKMKVELNEARYRKDSYLCFEYLSIKTKNYIETIGSFNLALRTLFIAAATSGGPQAKALFKATKALRDGKHFAYIKELFSNSHCKGRPPLSWLKNLPFKTHASFSLQTNVDATTQIRKPQWTVNHYQSPSGIRRKKSFCLEARYQIQGILRPNVKITTAEFPMEGFSKLKCLSGFP